MENFCFWQKNCSEENVSKTGAKKQRFFSIYIYKKLSQILSEEIGLHGFFRFLKIFLQKGLTNGIKSVILWLLALKPMEC